MTKRIVDLSSYQASSLAYMKQLKSYGVDGAMIKLTEGTSYLSPKASAQVANGLKTFKTVGAYHFFHGAGTAEAKYFLAWVKKFGLDKSTVLAIDVEYQGLPYYTTSQVNVFLRYLISHGYKHVITYGSASWFNSGRINRNQLVDKHIWVAAYNSYGPGVANADAWQYTNSFHGVDASYDYTGALSGTSKSPVKAKPKKAVYFDWAPVWIYTKQSVKAYKAKADVGSGKRVAKTYGKHVKLQVKARDGHRFQLANGTWITANKAYVNNLYYTIGGGLKQVKSISGTGRYSDVSLKRKYLVDKYPKATQFDVVKVVAYGNTTRLLLANGLYISGSKLINGFVK